MRRVARPKTATHLHTGDTSIIQPHKVAKFVGGHAIRLGSHVPEAARGVLIQTRVGGCRKAGVVLKAAYQPALQCEADLAPCRGNDARFDLVALNAIEHRRFVVLIEKPDRQQHQTSAQIRVPSVGQAVLNVGLLHGDLTTTAVTAFSY